MWQRFEQPIRQVHETIHCKLEDGQLLYRLKLVQFNIESELYMVSEAGEYRFLDQGYEMTIRKGKKTLARNRFQQRNYYSQTQPTYLIDFSTSNDRNINWIRKNENAELPVFQAKSIRRKGDLFYEFYFNHTQLGQRDLDCLVGLSFLHLYRIVKPD